MGIILIAVIVGLLISISFELRDILSEIKSIKEILRTNQLVELDKKLSADEQA